MIKRESLQKKLAMAAIAGMLMLLLAASCVAQTPLEMSGPENCTDCSANASSSPGLDDAVQETDLSNASISQELGAADLVSPSGILNTGKPTYVWEGVDGSQYYCLEVRDDRNNVVLKQWYDASDYPPDTYICNAAAKPRPRRLHLENPLLELQTERSVEPGNGFYRLHIFLLPRQGDPCLA